MVFGKRIEKGIRYSPEEDVYYVQFNFKDISRLNSFPTLEDARAYRDAVNAAKLERKIQRDRMLIREKEIAELKKEKDYPINLLNVIGLDFDNVEIVDKIDSIIEEICSEREYVCISLFFKDKMTLEEIGKEHGLTKERIRQIIAKGIKKLKIYLVHYNKIKSREQEIADRHSFRQQLIDAYKENGIITDDMRYEFGELYINGTNAYGELDELDLSVRTYNALKRAGFTKIKEISELSYNDLINIRGMGKKSAKELIKKLRTLGITLLDN